MKQSAIKIATIKDLSHEQWLELRRSGLGGSDASTVIGLNPYSSKLTLYADKKGILPEKEDTERMRLGRDLEEYVAQRFSEETGKKVKRSGYMWRHPMYEFLLANIDREVIGEDAFLECKTTMNYEKHDYLYFCARAEMDGRHNFARTLSEHNRNAEAYHRALNALNVR